MNKLKNGLHKIDFGHLIKAIEKKSITIIIACLGKKLQNLRLFCDKFFAGC